MHKYADMHMMPAGSGEDHDHGAHEHGGHAGHSHGVSADADRGKLSICSFALIVGFMLVEVVVGTSPTPRALLSDAAHMLTDAAAIALALLAIRLARRPGGGSFTFGLNGGDPLPASVRATLFSSSAS